jgi:hypothetical protein
LPVARRLNSDIINTVLQQVLIMKPYLILLLSGCMIAGLLISSAGAVSDEAKAQWLIAKDLVAGGKCSSALVASEKAIRMDPLFAYPWNVKGAALHCLGRNQAAVEAFGRAVELDPTFTLAQKNQDHVLLDIRNGAPPDTPAIVLPSVRNASLAYDGELGYVPAGEPTGCSSLSKDGHAVFYANNRTIAVTGVRMAGCRYGKAGGKARIEIWDSDFTTLYSDTILHEQIPFTAVKDEEDCLTNSSWVDIDLPDHEVSGDFYVVLFTNSLPISMKEPGIFIVYDTPSGTGTSFTVTTNPNRVEEQTVGKAGYRPEELDWMIHVLYTVSPSPTVVHGETQALKPQAEESQKPKTASTPLGLVSVIGALSIIAGCSIFRK